jgi:ATP-dependent DNA helicase RecG
MLTQPVTVLWGVGLERAALLTQLGIRTVEELLLHRPRRYEDRRQFRPIARLAAGESVLTGGRVVAAGVKRWRRGTRSLYELILEDGTGRLHCRWWNLPFMEDQFQVGEELVVFGRVRSLKPTTIDHPETEVVEGGEERSLHVGRIVPIYPLTAGLTQRWLRGLMWRALAAAAPHLADPWPAVTAVAELSRARALQRLHFPETDGDAETARRRLALDEFFELQLAIQRRRRALQTKAAALPCAGDNRWMRPFLARLGFTLTEAQTRVLREIRADLGGPHPMRRLLQGDVGSGKTVVAACAALMALESGYDAAFMAPTEVLAGQQFARFRAWFEPLGLRVELRTGSRKTGGTAAETPTLFAATTSGTANARPVLTVGTHALIGPGFVPERLGLVTIDEQHKFGVAQRERLVRKGRYPHLLVMTATPIPRTLGLTLYGDLDVSVIDALPAGRGRLRTFVRTADRLPKVWEFVRDQLCQGRQAFVVYPRVEDADPAAGVKAVLAEFERLQTALAPHRVGLLHGRLGAEEKDRVMAAFRANRLQALVTTSVIEVGVDVPNASVMVVENAESFGLAQLHQLRGRVARTPHPAYCILVAAAKTVEARERLRVLEETTDGFRIAEADLRLRGPGELLGQAQSGLPAFRFGDLANDLALVEQARALARDWLAAEPGGAVNEGPAEAAAPEPPPGR